MAVPSLKLNRAMVICPICGEVYQRVVEEDFLASPYVWGYIGRPAIICEDCRKDIYKFKQEGYFDGNRVST